MKFVEKLGMIVTCSDDRFTNFWVPPRSWRIEESAQKEEDIEVEVAKKKDPADDSSDDGYGQMGEGIYQSHSESDSEDKSKKVKKSKKGKEEEK